MDNVLITGVCGFLGRYIARAIAAQDRAVYGVDVASPENAPALAGYFPLSLPTPELRQIIAKLDLRYCVHCAGRASVIGSIEDPRGDFESGPVVTFELLNLLRELSPNCRILFLSSAAVYGNPASLPVSEVQEARPISPYGFHKWQSELVCREFAEVFGLRTAFVRIFSAYGPGLRRQVLWDICRQLLVESRLHLHGTGAESRDFAHARDIADAVLTVLEAAPMEGEAYNVATGRETTIRALAEEIAESLGKEIPPVFDGKSFEGYPNNWRADISKIARLGFVPKVELSEGVQNYVRWAREELGGVA